MFSIARLFSSSTCVFVPLLLATDASAVTLTIGPSQSIQDTLNRMSAGDMLVLNAGRYPEGNLSPPSGVTIKAAPGAQVVIAPNNQGVDTIFDLQGGKHDIVFDGLILDGGKQTAFPIYSDHATARITFQNGALRNGRHSAGLLSGTQWTLRNNQIVGNGVTCCSTGEDDHGLYFGADHSQILGNTFADNACYNLQVYSSTGHNPTDNIISGNLFTRSKCGVTLSMGANHTFVNNIIVDDATQFQDTGLLVFTPNTRVEGNTFVRSDVIVDKAGVNGQQIVNNRFCEATLTGVSFAGNTQTCDNLPAFAAVPGVVPASAPTVGPLPPLVPLVAAPRPGMGAGRPYQRGRACYGAICP